MTQISRDAPSRSCTVVDLPKILASIVFLVLQITVALLICQALNIENVLIVFYILCPTILLCSIIININVQGYIIDVENNRFEFPGCYIETESLISYLKPNFFLKALKRHHVQLSEIHNVESYRYVSTSNRKNSKIGRVTHARTMLSLTSTKKDVLKITGDFGTVSFVFWSKGTRDQLYSAIVSINKAGGVTSL